MALVYSITRVFSFLSCPSCLSCLRLSAREVWPVRQSRRCSLPPAPRELHQDRCYSCSSHDCASDRLINGIGLVRVFGVSDLVRRGCASYTADAINITSRVSRYTCTDTTTASHLYHIDPPCWTIHAHPDPSAPLAAHSSSHPPTPSCILDASDEIMALSSMFPLRLLSHPIVSACLLV
jgi:hypothetical protein